MDAQPRETATAERANHIGRDGLADVLEAAMGEPEALVQKVVAAPLDRLWKDKRISQREYHAGCTFREDHHESRLDPGASTSNWHGIPAGFGPKVPSMYASQRAVDALMRRRKLDATFPPTSFIGRVLERTLIQEHSLEDLGTDMFAEGNHRDARKAGTAAFRTACAALADFYGL